MLEGEDLTLDDVLKAALEQLGEDYEFIRHLGGGEFSNVYLVRHAGTGEEQALKIMDYYYLVQKLKKQNHTDTRQKFDEIKRRFVNEAQMYEKIRHPNIVKIFSTGVINDDKKTIEIPYLLMNYIRGENLANILKKKAPFKISRVIRLSQNILSALDAIHKNKIIHRDLKPSNIMIDEKTGEAVIIDFGIAKDIVSTTRITTTGAFLGSPLYMAPEQFMDSSAVGIETDIYSFGVVLYEMLTGKPPFEGSNFLELMNAHRQKMLPDVVEKNPELPGLARAIISRSMAKKHELRYRSASAMLKDIKAMAGAKPYGKPLRQTKKTKKVLLYFFAASVVVAVAFLMVNPFGSQKMEKKPERKNGVIAEKPEGSSGKPPIAPGEKDIKGPDANANADAKEIPEPTKKIGEKPPVDEKENAKIAINKKFEEIESMMKDGDEGTSVLHKLNACRGFLDMLEKQPIGDDESFKEKKKRASEWKGRLNDEFQHDKFIKKTKEHLKNEEFNKAEYTLTKADAIIKNEKNEELAKLIKIKKTEFEKINGAAAYGELIKGTVKLSNYLEFKQAYPQSKFLVDLKKKLMETDKQLPPESYWEKEILKNRMGYYEYTFNGSANRHLMIYIPEQQIWIQKYEVSNRQFRDFLKDEKMPDTMDAENKYIHTGDEYPAVVTYELAVRYCRRYGFRLPTSQEWEYAAGKGIFAYPWGNELPGDGGIWRANYDTLDGDKEQDGYSGTAPVKSFESYASPFGVVNMAGNVWEWVEGKILKGGGFFSGATALEIKKNTGGREKDKEGFRCVKENTEASTLSETK
jgi:serine/threonine protein kinase